MPVRFTRRRAGRTALRATGGTLALTLAAGPLSVLGPLPRAAYAAAGPWPTYLGDNRHSGLSGNPGPRLLTLSWYVNLGDDVESSAVVANDGSVYVAANNGRVMGRQADGGAKWTFEAGARVYASPVLGVDGEILIGDTRGRFRALRPEDGTIAWTVRDLGSVRATTVVAPDGTAYVGTESGVLLALDSRDQGKEKFRLQARSGIVTAPAIADNGDVYWTALDNEMRRMNSRGNVFWQKALDGEVAAPPSIGPDGTVYAGAGASVVALNGDSGDVRWRAGLGGQVGTTPVIGPDGGVFAGADNGKLVAFNRDGTFRWEYQTGAPIRGSAAVSADGIVYVGSGDSTIYALGGDGRLLSTYRALDAVFGSIALAPDGTVFAGSKDNRLYALRDNVRAPATESPEDRIGGEVVRDPSSGRVFVIVDDRRRHIPDPETQAILGLVTPIPRALNAAELVRFPEGPALPSLKEGALIRAANGPIYVIRGGQRAWLRSAEDIQAGGFQPETAPVVEDRILRSLPLNAQEGMLVKGTGERVYVVTGGQRRWLTTPGALNARGDWSQVHFISDAALNAIPEGEQLSS
ncbi:MAG TPA: PQQ-binding-like beta-propeller repeat protein [Chloroflexota bacterium]|nr:PQQ-binding-like beta-propeller repeat protein [Chloroflexota bacterium]